DTESLRVPPYFRRRFCVTQWVSLLVRFVRLGVCLSAPRSGALVFKTGTRLTTIRPVFVFLTVNFNKH
ncbi:MAG: hypothetical protein NC350_06305, partial [Corallococcus sp.]|nr:hypothetical protein [Corallococcus sp.]